MSYENATHAKGASPNASDGQRPTGARIVPSAARYVRPPDSVLFFLEPVFDPPSKAHCGPDEYLKLAATCKPESMLSRDRGVF
jgi:hypothetical protein